MCSFSCLLCGKFGQSLTPKTQENCKRTAKAMTQRDVIITNTKNKLSTQFIFPLDA